MKYSLIEDMFPQYLAFKSSEILKDQIVINIDCQQKHMKCPRFGRESNNTETDIESGKNFIPKGSGNI